jgi:hypothetical protein
VTSTSASSPAVAAGGATRGIRMPWSPAGCRRLWSRLWCPLGWFPPSFGLAFGDCGSGTAPHCRKRGQAVMAARQPIPSSASAQPAAGICIKEYLKRTRAPMQTRRRRRRSPSRPPWEGEGEECTSSGETTAVTGKKRWGPQAK